ncbi:hypothetical protein N0Y54_37060 [Nostoc punctiforme UO1]|uniref:hypothetical protein n=1 Tax=Nostoc punctiforme TaxID=272131 RepID=UPI0030A7AAD7
MLLVENSVSGGEVKTVDEGERSVHAPLRGASPQTVQGVEELEEDSPTANDCTSLALVDDAPSQSASLRDAARTLLAENQDCGVEQKDCYEGTFSAAPVAQNEFSLNSAIAIKKLLL